MQAYTFSPADDTLFPAYYAVYAEADITSAGYVERTESPVFPGHGVFVHAHGQIVGGFSLCGNTLCDVFLVAPFEDRQSFWPPVLQYALRQSKATNLVLRHIPIPDADILHTLGATTHYAQRRMCRPTAPVDCAAPEGFRFDAFTAADIADIAQVVAAAHAHGFTSTLFGTPVIAEVKQAIRNRYDAFAQTGTLALSTLSRQTGTEALTGVCIAGIYPDADARFSTLHQLSVLPEHQGHGLATALMRHTIGKAHAAASPVITLGVYLGNPAEGLYRKEGFLPGPAYARLAYTPS